MVFLTSLDMLDTGFLEINSTARLSSENMVNSGDAIRLKSVTFDIMSTASLDENTTPDNHNIIRDNGAESHALISINKTEVTISILINNKNTDTDNEWGINDMALLPYLIRLPKTRGLKALYYPVDNTATDAGSNNSRQRNRQLIHAIGTSDRLSTQSNIDIPLWTGTTSETSKDLTDVNYLLVRFKSCQITQVTKTSIQVILSGVISS